MSRQMLTKYKLNYTSSNKSINRQVKVYNNPRLMEVDIKFITSANDCMVITLILMVLLSNQGICGI